MTNQPILEQGESAYTLIFIVKMQRLETFHFKNLDIKFGFKSIKLV
jgi:hypothetical protein